MTGEMPLEERLIHGNVLDADCGMPMPHLDHTVDQQKRIAMRDHLLQLLHIDHGDIHRGKHCLRRVVHGFQPPALFDFRPDWASLRRVTTSRKNALAFCAGAPSTSSPGPTSLITPDCAPMRA